MSNQASDRLVAHQNIQNAVEMKLAALIAAAMTEADWRHIDHVQAVELAPLLAVVRR